MPDQIQNQNVDNADKDKPKEKTPAELIAESLKPVIDKFDAMSKDFDEFKTKAIQRPVQTREEIEQRTQQQPKASVFDDEDQAFAQRMTPLAIETLNTKFELMFDRVKNEYARRIGEDAWNEIEPDVRKSLEDANVNPVLRSNPQYIKNTIRMIMGEKAETGFRFDSKDKRFFLEDTSHAAENAAKAPKPEDGLTPRQLKAAKSFGMPLDEYKKTLEKLEIVS